RDTTGLLVIARTLPAHTSLVNQLQAREIGREYEAVVIGQLTGGGTVDEPLGRHPVNRKKRAGTAAGKTAVSHYRGLQRLRAHSHVQVILETGRTHQIRVHMAHISHPLVGDPLYGGRLRLPAACGETMRAALTGFKRQALHARCLRLQHPLTAEHMEWQAETPSDLQQLLDVLAADLKEVGA
ncbi:MAG: pseudouridine synthase, partial [Gammaproteobacteria bacterium]